MTTRPALTRESANEHRTAQIVGALVVCAVAFGAWFVALLWLGGR